MFPYIFFVSLSALAMGILNSFHRFAAPAFAPGSLEHCDHRRFRSFRGMVLQSRDRPGGGSGRWRVAPVGDSGSALVAKRLAVRNFISTLSHPGVRRVGKLMLPVIFGVGIVQVNVLVDTQFASYLEEGSVTASVSRRSGDGTCARRLRGRAFDGDSACTVAAGGGAEARRDEDHVEFRNAAHPLFITIPATVGLICPAAANHRGSCSSTAISTRASTALTAWPLLFFAIGLIRVFDGEDHCAGVLCTARHDARR